MKIPKLRFKEFSVSWEEKRLGDIADIYDGTHQTPTYVERGIPFYSVENITNSNFFNSKHVSEETYQQNNKKRKLEKNDILMTRIGSIGESKLIDWDIKADFYVSLALIKVNLKYYPSYINQFIKSNFFQKQLSKKTLTVAFPQKINLGDIGECLVKVPCLEEQEKIGNFLSSVDKKISITEEKLNLFKDYKKGMMQKIFKQEIRFKDENGQYYPDWVEKTLGELGEIITGKTPSTKEEKYWNGDIPFITPTDMNENKYQVFTQRNVSKNINIKILPVGTIMFTCIASIGKMAISTKECITNQQINSIITTENIYNEYVYYALSNLVPKIQASQSTTTLPIINKTEFSKFTINLPCLEEQQKIANFLSSIDNKIENLSTELENLKLFKKGLLQKMFI